MVTTRPNSAPTRQSGRNRLVLVGLAIIIIFAVIGVVSAGIFVGSAFSSSSKTGSSLHPTVPPSTLRDVHRAQAQATRIVAQARKSGRAASLRLTKRARAQATALVETARHRAAAIAAAVPTPVPAPPPTSSVPGPAYSGGSNSSTGTTSPGGSTGSAQASGAVGAPGPGTVPASWKVVAYNATFSNGGAGVGTVTVLNRSTTTFSGTVKIVYSRGGAAYASFAGLAPGGSEVLPLSGTPYPGGGYRILLPSVR